MDQMPSMMPTAPTEDTPLTVDAPGVLGNDVDVDGDSLTVTATPIRSQGTVAIRQLSDLHARWLQRPDSFNYTVPIARKQQSPITVTPVNDCPEAVDDGYDAVEDQTLTVTADLGVLVNDEDEDSATLTVASFDATSVNGGTVALSGDGSFVYTPAADFCGDDTFTYKVTDGICESQDVGEVTIYVECVEDNICPVATDDEYDAIEDTPLNVPVDTGVLDNDEDANVGDTLTVASFDTTSVNGGTVALSSDGSFVYTPAADFCGDDTFTYKVTDGKCTQRARTLER